MRKKVTQEMLDRFHRGQCTKEEHRQVLAWLASTGAKGEAAFHLRAQWDKAPKEALPDPIDFEALYGKIRETKRQQEQAQSAKSFRPLLRVAASFAGFMAIGMLAYTLLVRQKEVVYATAFGQTKTITLPDRSVVTLNGNSSIRYEERLSPEQPREVWLEGQAFFSVVHTGNDQKFMVHTSEGLQIEVLGTEFNVSSRKSGTNVVLNSGRIQLHLPESETVVMQPGEMVQLSGASETYTKTTVNPEVYSSWKNHLLLLDDTPLQHIISMLEESHGLQVEVEDPALLRLRGSGSMPFKDLNVLLRVIAETFDLQVYQHQGKVIFSHHPAPAP
ncbi:FecR family protein [soil metagenome]